MIQVRYHRWATLVLFAIGAVLAGATVAGPGFSWDEPAYRHSQVTLQNWFRELAESESWEERGQLLDADAIEQYWEFSRFGHNFHPPMGSLLNLCTFGVMHGYWDDTSSRRLASALELAGAATFLCHFLGRRFGTLTGAFAGLSLLTMPRLMGDAHIIGTDMPLMFFWSATALAFYRGMDSRRWQVWTAFLAACLFLVKFTGVVLAAPCALWFVVAALRGTSWKARWGWLIWTLAIVLPLLPLALTLLFGSRATESIERLNSPSVMDALARLGLQYRYLLSLSLLWPGITWLLFRWRSQLPKDPSWKVGLELPWVVLALTPLFSIAMNPSWWHDPVRLLVSYFGITLNRQGVLPDIEIFYLGQKYLYSLPWHNGWVLMAVTIPFGTLLCGILGTAYAIIHCRRESVPIYFMLQMVALPVFRMLPTPAHDGVRLFLPTFFFFAGLAGIGAAWIVRGLAGKSREMAPTAIDTFPTRTNLRRERFAWVALFLLGPAWGAYDWVRIHPYELSYYNIGLANAVDAGFETTYWYDAVTPGVLHDLNDKFPPNVVIGFPDPMINPDTFAVLQDMGRLRSDVRSHEPGRQKLPWFWLLSHSSKATAFTRLLYAVPPWYESGHDGVRLFSVVDDEAAAVAWTLHALVVERDPKSGGGPVLLREDIISMDPTELKHAMQRLTQLLEKSPSEVTAAMQEWPVADQQRVAPWIVGGAIDANLASMLRIYPDAVERAIDILATRKDDVRAIIAYPGYMRPETFGGYLYERTPTAENPHE